MKEKRYGEKVGWTGGWMGGFLWVFVLSLFFFHQKRIGPGALGLLLWAAAVAAVLIFAPWRHPTTPYWKLMLAPYGVFLGTVAWALWAFGGVKNAGFSAWNLLWLIPALSPFGLLSPRKWTQDEDRPPVSPDGSPDPPQP
uniref:SPW repeat-containing protein n=1 Tax=Desulfacinum infernum TaxID=35837 RepID=A0A832A1J6_9BACT